MLSRLPDLAMDSYTFELYVLLGAAIAMFFVNIRATTRRRRSSSIFSRVNQKYDRVLRKLLESRYVGLLEGELLRLRAENRALTNSLLGTAGFPPVDFPKRQSRKSYRGRAGGVGSVTINGEAITASPRAEQNIFLPGALTTTWTGATWTLDKAHRDASAGTGKDRAGRLHDECSGPRDRRHHADQRDHQRRRERFRRDHPELLAAHRDRQRANCGSGMYEEPSGRECNRATPDAIASGASMPRKFNCGHRELTNRRRMLYCVRDERTRKNRMRAAEAGLCVWFIVAFAWYFLQFKPLLGIVTRILFRR